MKKLIGSIMITLIIVSVFCTNTIKVQADINIENWDFNRDYIIDVVDLASLASNYNITNSDTEWNSKYDLNGDYIIDIYDLVKVSKSIGTILDNMDITDKFTDTNFKSAVYTLIGKKSPEPILYSDIKSIKELIISNKNIKNLEGIEYFKALTKLDCSNNQLITLDVSSNTELTTLVCYYNELKTLYSKIDIWNPDYYKTQYTDAIRAKVDTSLTITTDNTDITSKFTDNNFRSSVYTLINKSSSLPIFYSDVKDIKEVNIAFKNINDLSGIEYFRSLTTLSCSYNQLSALDIRSNLALKYLYCEDNELITIDIGGNSKLEEIYCMNNKLTTLDTSKNTLLTKLNCYNNKLAILDVSSNTNLTSLICDSNELKTLNVSNNISLTKLTCENNKLKALDVSKNTLLKYLSCSYNELILFYDIENRWDDNSYKIQYADTSHKVTTNSLIVTIKK